MGVGSSRRSARENQQQQQQQQWQNQNQYPPPPGYNLHATRPPNAGPPPNAGQGQMAMMHHAPANYQQYYNNIYTQNYPPPPSLYPTAMNSRGHSQTHYQQQQQFQQQQQLMRMRSQQQQQQQQQRINQFPRPAPTPTSSTSTPPANSVPDISRTTVTIRNDVNLNKSTLSLNPLSSTSSNNDNIVKLRFKFDAATPCAISIFVDAVDEAGAGSGNAIKGDCIANCRVERDKGLGQSFECPSVIHLSKYSDSRLTSVSTVPAATTASGTSNRSSPQTNDRYPLIIRMERRSATAIENGDKLPEPPGSALPSWVQAQTTYCVLEKIAISSSSSTPAPSSSKRFKYNVKCVKQKIVVEGVSYELKEIYGIEKTMGNRVNAVSGNSVNGSKANGNSGSAQGDGSGENGTDASIDPAIDNDDGAECVICLSEPKTTTVFPCRHLCMCRDCAKMLASQTNRCPVCRSVIEGMLEIKVKEADNGTSENNTDTTSASNPISVTS